MKIGYTAVYGPEEKKRLLRAGVEKIIIGDKGLTEIESFTNCLNQNQSHQIVLVSLASIGPSVTTRELVDTLLVLRRTRKSFHVINQGVDVRVSDCQYRDLLLKFGETDQAAYKIRTKVGLEKARLNGKIGGRPKINQEVAERIYFLYHTQKETLRQIASDCNVSIGTAYKYANQ